MQNKPNFHKAQININSFVRMRYVKLDTWWIGKNKANSNPIKANLSQFQCQTKPNKPNLSQNKPNSNPICRKAKIDAKCAYTKDYEKKPLSGPEKTKPIQTQFL